MVAEKTSYSPGSSARISPSVARTSPVTAAAIGAHEMELGGMSRISPVRLSNTRRPPPLGRQPATCWATLP